MEDDSHGYSGKSAELGGMVNAIKQNYPQREIADASFRYQEEVDSGKRIVVGVNRYEQTGDPELAILRIARALERKQIDRLNGVRGRRRGIEVEAALTVLKQAAE